MFVFWGDGSQDAMDLVDSIIVRSTENFNWTFIFILAVVFYVYWSEISKKNYSAIYHFGKSTTPDRPDQTWVKCLNLFVAGYTV